MRPSCCVGSFGSVFCTRGHKKGHTDYDNPFSKGHCLAAIPLLDQTDVHMLHRPSGTVPGSACTNATSDRLLRARFRASISSFLKSSESVPSPTLPRACPVR